jgi:CHAT domain-containing protein
MPGKSRLLFSPDGPLGTIPIALLREPGTGTALLDRMDCRIVPSARILIWQQGSARKGAAAANGRLENVLALAGVADAEGRPLARAAREVRDLERHYENVSARTALSETLGPKVRLADRGYAVLHVASHVDVDDQSPWQSALCLSPGPASGRITALDIAGMRLPHRLVVLSGCETARGRALNGEGVQGLSAAFLSAGASCVVASLWPAPDRETAVLMRHFYSELAGGRTVGEALRGAQKTMREAPETRAPVYWSGFLVIGSGDVRVALQPRRFTLTSMVLAGVGFLALIAVWHGFRRRRSHQMRGL